MFYLSFLEAKVFDENWTSSMVNEIYSFESFYSVSYAWIFYYLVNIGEIYSSIFVFILWSIYLYFCQGFDMIIYQIQNICNGLM